MRIPLIEDKYADGAGRALARLRQGKVVFQPKLARKLLAIGMVALSLTLAGWLNSGLWSSKAALHSPLNGLACGQPGSGCEVLAKSIANPRSLSKALPDGSFFVGSAGSPSNDLFGEAVAGVDINSSTIFRYTGAGGLQPWVSAKPSQLITLFDATFSSFVPFQTGINGVEVMGRDLVYSLSYNAGATNYVDRMRSYTAETGLTFSEVRRIAGGAANPNGPETVIANRAAAPAAVAESCRPQASITSIERVDIGTITESFLVRWDTTSPCVTSFEVSLTVTRADGSQRSDKRKFDRGARSAVFKLAGKRDDNLTKAAKAVVTATGVLAAKGSLVQNLGIAPGVGSGGAQAKAPTPAPIPTFKIQGKVINAQNGTPLTGAEIFFDVVGGGGRVSSTKSDSLGRWEQGGFPIGKKARVTAFKPFFIIEPAELLVDENTGIAQFTARPSNNGSKSAPTPAQTFTAGGRAVVNSLSQGTQTPLPGATISFTLLNTKPGQAKAPGPVTTQKDGRWSQSGFTAGFTYQARISKSGVAFNIATANFASSNGQPVNDVGFIGTVK